MIDRTDPGRLDAMVSEAELHALDRILVVGVCQSNGSGP